MVLLTLAAETRAALDGYEKNVTISASKILGTVKQDLSDRIDMGAKKYGTRLKTNNGRNVMLDLYQEILDAAHYMKQAQMEGKL